MNKHHIYLRAETLADVVIRAHDSIVSSGSHGGLEQRVHSTFSSGDVLLVIRFVVGKALPSVLLGLLVLIDFSSNLEARRRDLGWGDP